MRAEHDERTAVVARARAAVRTVGGLRAELSSRLNIENANIKASNLIEFLANNGDIRIIGTQIYASNSITMASSPSAKFEFGDISASRTDKTSIETGRGAQIVGQGGAKIVQDEDGSIKFYT